MQQNLTLVRSVMTRQIIHHTGHGGFDTMAVIQKQTRPLAPYYEGFADHGTRSCPWLLMGFDKGLRPSPLG